MGTSDSDSRINNFPINTPIDVDYGDVLLLVTSSKKT